MRILIAAENCSARFGGEAFLPLLYFRFLRARGKDVWLLAHARTRLELTQLLANDSERVHFVEDKWLHRFLWRLGSRLPQRLSQPTLGLVSYLYTQWLQRRMVMGLVARHRIDIVHQPMPVSPKAPSLLFNVGVPVVIGPMNGGMEFPPAFQYLQGTFVRHFLKLARACSNLANLLIPGKVLASVLLVANQRTRNALPARVCGNVVELVENGVDLSIWKQSGPKASRPGSAIRFIFIGRLVDWKAVDLLLEAFSAACGKADISLLIVGDGPMRGELEALARTMGISDRVTFSGFLSQPVCARQLAECDALLLPSLFECGGAVVLEAMASGIPVIATNWGGPADYLDETCGILIGTSSREALVSGFSDAMVRLAQQPELRASLGAAARVRVVEHFDWEKKTDRILQIYQSAIRSRPQPATLQSPAGISIKQGD